MWQFLMAEFGRIPTHWVPVAAVLYETPVRDVVGLVNALVVGLLLTL
jgi:hypothetical protein